MILLNPVVISVIVLVVLCLFKLPVFAALLISGITAGLASGYGFTEIMSIFVGGMGGNANTALSYVLLGALAFTINKTGAAAVLSRKISSVVKGNKMTLIIIFVLLAMASGTIIPVHIAFIPIFVPPLLIMMNKMKMDRRQVAISFGFGLKAPYITIPIAYGAIFHGLIVSSINGTGLMTIEMGDVWRSTWVIGIAMAIGLVFGVIYFSKDREYEDRPLKGFSADEGSEAIEITTKHKLTLAAGLIALLVQLKTGSLPLGALASLIFLVLTGVIKWRDIDEIINGGLSVMGYIAFVMLLATGYAAIINSSGAVVELVDATTSILGGSKLGGALVMMLLGLLVTMGIGTSFGTVPVLAVIYVPLAMELGFSMPATIVMIAAAASLGDAGSPASDTTLGPTSGLNADGQHDHIWDTCVPQFICYNIPLFIVGMLAPIFM